MPAVLQSEHKLTIGVFISKYIHICIMHRQNSVLHAMTEIYLAKIFLFYKTIKYNNVYPEHPYTKYKIILAYTYDKQ